MHHCEFYEKLDAGKGGGEGVTRCMACKHYCSIPDGETGICGVRLNKGGKLHLMVYGYPAAVHVDPVEKKPLYHFLPGQKVFSIGTVGCNLSCKFCQNWDLSQSTKILKGKVKEPEARRKALGKLCEGRLTYGMAGGDVRPDLEFDEGVAMGQEKMPPEKVVEICEEGEIPAIAYTYNEPTIFIEYARDIGVLAREKGIRNIFVTSGYESREVLEACDGWLDAMNIDLKSFSADFYRDVCGIQLEGVLETIRRAFDMGIWIEITTLVVPGLNDSSEELNDIARFIAGLSVDIPWHVTAFHPCYKMMDRPSTSKEDLERAWKIGKDAGLRYVYTGNVMGGHEDTECPKCGEVVIERFRMDCRVCRVAEGKCPMCGEEVGGVFS
jgi:pyruvate formate lyase activating enzyme